MPTQPNDPFSVIGDLLSGLFDASSRKKINGIAQMISGARDLDLFTTVTTTTTTTAPVPPVAPVAPKPTIDPLDPFGKRTVDNDIVGRIRRGGVTQTKTTEGLREAVRTFETSKRPADDVEDYDNRSETLREGIREAAERADRLVSQKQARGSIDINGWTHEVDGDIDLLVIGSTVLLNGKKIEVDFSLDRDVMKIEVLSGKINSIITTATVQANRVDGNVYSKGDSSIGAVGGNATVGGDLNTSSIGGNANASGDIAATTVGGNLHASGDITIK